MPQKRTRYFVLALVFGVLSLSMLACTIGPLTVGGCNDGPYKYDGSRYPSCTDKNGNGAVDDCCCFVASASNLNHEQIDTLRTVRNWMLANIRGFDKVNDLYHTVVGPETANYLRAHPMAQKFSHNILAPLADLFNLFVR